MLLLALLACSPTKDAATPTDGGGDGGASDGGASDGGTSDGGGETTPGFHDLSWRVNDEIGAVLHLSWRQGGTGTVRLRFQPEGGEVMESPARTRGPGEQEELILGVPYDTPLTAWLVGDFDGRVLESEPLDASTDPLPEGLPLPELRVAEPDAWVETDRYLMVGVSISDRGFQSSGYYKVIYDRQGKPVWAHLTPDSLRTMFMQPSPDGSEIVWDQTTFWTTFDEGKASVVNRMKIDGTVLEVIPTPGLHHSFRMLPDGTLAWSGFDGTDEVLRERAPDGSVRYVWNCSDYWAAQGSRMQCDGNAITWNEADDTWYFSSDNENTVVEIQRETGEVLRSFGQLPGSYAFSEGSGNFWKQHHPSRTPEGNLLITTHESSSSQEMRAREYRIDDANRILEEVWSCGDGSGTSAPFMGEGHRLANGNTLLNYGGGGAIREYTRDGRVVWHLEWRDRNTTSHSVFVEDLYAFAP